MKHPVLAISFLLLRWAGLALAGLNGVCFAQADAPFSDIHANLVGVTGGSAVWGDFDGDGDLDILLAGQSLAGPTSLIYQNRDGTFTNIQAGLPGVAQSSVAWADFDRDRDLDLLLTGRSSSGFPLSLLYRNIQDTLVDTQAGLPGVAESSAAWGDYDQDHDLDLILTGKSASGVPVSLLYRNDEGAFVNVPTGLPGVANGSVAWGDYDRDGDLDLILTGRTVKGIPISLIYRNDDGVLVDIQAGLPGVEAGSVAWGDYDRDGDLDLVLAGQTYSGLPLSLVYRDEQGVFVDVRAGLPGVAEGSVAWGDIDHDGDLDLVLTGRTGSGVPLSLIYRNDDGVFADLEAGLTGVGNSAVAWGDYDRDGALDLLLTGLNSAGTSISVVYRNELTQNEEAFSDSTGQVEGSSDGLDSSPSIKAVFLGTEGCHLRVQGRAGVTYRLEASTDLHSWKGLGSGRANPEGAVEFTDPDARRIPGRFYRITAP
jgi:FG-GAP-like repeat